MDYLNKYNIMYFWSNDYPNHNTVDNLFENKPEITNLLQMIKDEHYHVYILGSTDDLAIKEFASIVNRSWNKYGRIINALDNLVSNNILDLINTNSRQVTSGKELDTTEDSAVDHTLHKYNDTPRSGNNPDLTADTYLTASDRNTINLGERHRFISEDGTVLEVVTSTDNFKQFEAIANIESVIDDYYDKWINYIDRKLFIL